MQFNILNIYSSRMIVNEGKNNRKIKLNDDGASVF